MSENNVSYRGLVDHFGTARPTWKFSGIDNFVELSALEEDGDTNTPEHPNDHITTVPSRFSW